MKHLNETLTWQSKDKLNVVYSDGSILIETNGRS